MTGIKQQTFWITGASSGIGKALAHALAEEGHQLIISSRGKDSLEAFAQNYPDLITVLPCDVADEQQMLSLFEIEIPELEYLDGIFLCAGICDYIDLPDFQLKAFKKAISINFMGTVHSCAAAYNLLKAKPQDSKDSKPFIAGICSMSSYLGFPRAEAYGSSKAAMAYFLNSLRADIGDKVDVIPVYMGFVDTPMTKQNDFPMPFLITPEQAAKGVLKSLQKRPLRIDYPWRLYAVLSILAKLPSLWYKTIMGRLRRSQGRQS